MAGQCPHQSGNPLNAQPPARGDIYRVDLDPIRGQEQRGKRSVFVLSPAEFNRRGLMIVLPPSWFRPKPEIIFVRVNQWVPLPERVARVAVQR